jgi:hypothetical protein
VTEPEAGDEAPPRRARTAAARPGHPVASLNATLAAVGAHFDELTGKLANYMVQLTPERFDDRDDLISRLAQSDGADLVYFFYHAAGGAANPAIDPPELASCYLVYGLMDR